MVASKRSREKVKFAGTPDALLEKLFTIRLVSFIESPPQKTKGRYKTVKSPEEMGLSELKLKTKIPFSVYDIYK